MRPGLAICLLVAALSAGEAPRPGDPDSVFDPGRFDERYPIQREFAKAGVRGGIPPRESLPIRERLRPGDDLRAALARAGEADGGVVLLAPGTYRLVTEAGSGSPDDHSRALAIPSGVVLRGSGPRETVIEYGVSGKITPLDPEAEVGEDEIWSGRRLQRMLASLACLRMVGAEHAGIEDLAFRHVLVSRLDPASFRNRYAGNVKGSGYALWIEKCADCWVQNCRITDTVSGAVMVHDCEFVTMRDNLVARAYLKGGGGNGYYSLIGNRYVLLYNEEIYDLRHLGMLNRLDYTVIYGCRGTVDINWHGGKPMARVLVEDCRFYLPPKHWWPVLAKWKDPIGAENYLYRLDGWFRGRAIPPDLGLYLHTDDGDVPRPAPAHGTMYPVTGRHVDPPEEAAAAERFTRVEELRTGPATRGGEELRALLDELVAEYPETPPGVYAACLKPVLAAEEERAAERATARRLEESPGYADYRAALALFRKMRFDAAVAALRQVIADHPGTPAAEAAAGKLRDMGKEP